METSSNYPKKKLVIFLPISVPGSGKSFLMGHFKSYIKSQSNAELHVISSDTLRKQLMDDLLSKDPSLLSDELFSKTSKRAPHHFNEELLKLLKKISKEENSQEMSFLFIDKNNLPPALPRVLAFLHDKCDDLFDQWRFVGVFPDSFLDHRVSNRLKYPFSINFMLNCLQRIQNRKGSHETLNGQGYKSANILFSFINAFRNIQLNEQTIIEEFGMHAAIKMPMTLENSENNNKYDADVVEAFNDIIKDDNQRFDTEKNKEKIQKFLELFEGKQYVIEQVTLENIRIFLENVWESCGNLFKPKKNEQKHPKQQEETKEKEAYTKEKEIYNKIPAKLPVFLGVFVNDQNSAQNEICDYIMSNLQWHLNRNPSDHVLEADLKNFKQIFKFPRSIHVTALFLGGNKNQANTPIFKEFQEGIPLKIELEAIIYVPDKIICGVCFFDKNLIKIDNEIPHMTLMIGEFPAKNSNDVLQSLFNSVKSPLKGKYSQEFFRKEESIDLCFSDVLMDLGRKVEKNTVYVLREGKRLVFEATTKFQF